MVSTLNPVREEQLTESRVEENTRRYGVQDPYSKNRLLPIEVERRVNGNALVSLSEAETRRGEDAQN